MSDKLNNFSSKNREENLEKIRQILLDGAISQMQIESTYCSNEESNFDKDKPDFFDI